MPRAALTWIEPGASATLIWHGAVASQPGGGRLYVVSGPILEQPPASPYFILAAEEDGDFAARLYRDQVTLPDLRAFLARCRVTRGALVDDQQYVATAEEAAGARRARRLARAAGAPGAAVSRRHQRVHARRPPRST